MDVWSMNYMFFIMYHIVCGTCYGIKADIYKFKKYNMVTVRNAH